MKILAEPIDVIAKFIRKQNPLPIKFRYLDESGKEREIKVDKVINIEEVRDAGIKSLLYYCQSNISGEIKRYELRYIKEKCSWELFKI